MNRIAQWLVFIVSLVLMGIWYPMMYFRDDEKHLLTDNFGLDIKDSDDKPQDGIEDAFIRVLDSPSFHTIKNVAHEWAKNRPKLAVKFLMFLVDIQALIIVTIVTISYCLRTG